MQSVMVGVGRPFAPPGADRLPPPWTVVADTVRLPPAVLTGPLTTRLPASREMLPVPVARTDAVGPTVRAPPSLASRLMEPLTVRTEPFRYSGL